jgi:hypothetical protein
MISLKDIFLEAMGLDEACWKGYKQVGTKTKGNKTVPNCVRISEKKEKPGLWANIRAKRERGEAPAKKGSKAFKSAVKAAKEINKANK